MTAGRRVRRTVLAGLALLAGAYLLVAGYLFFAQRKFIYPGAARTDAIVGAIAGFRPVQIVTSDGLRLRAAYRPPAAGLPSFIFFHGNGDTLLGGAIATRQLAAAGYGMLLPEYRGYDGNPGSPSEAGFYADGRASLAWLADQGTGADRVVLIGNSLGSGVATQLALEQGVAGLILISGFTSLPDVAAEHVRWLPVRALLCDRYPNRSKIARVDAPVLVLHGTADTLIPARHGMELAKGARQPSLELFPGIGHDLAYRPEAQAAILRWAASKLR